MANVHVESHKNLSDDEKFDIQREIAREAKTPDYIAATIEHFKAFGMHIVVTDDAFVKVSRAFEIFVKEHGGEFPRLKEFLVKWQMYRQTWTVLMQQTRDFAAVTSAEYRTYDAVYLDLVQHLETQQDIKDAVEALTEFSKRVDPAVPLDFADRFKVLSEQMKLFKDDFEEYVQKPPTQKIKELEAKLKQAVETVNQCVHVIVNAATFVEFIPILAVLSNNRAFEATILGTIMKRKVALADAGRYENELEEESRKQPALASLQIQFFLIGSTFQRIDGVFAPFASSWSFFHSQALQFANVLKEVEDVSQIPETFKITVELARAVATPLERGLDAFSRVIVS